MKKDWLSNKNIVIDKVDKSNLYKKLLLNNNIDEIDEIYKKMSRAIFTKETLLKTKPINNSIQAIKKLSKIYNIYIITSRTEQMIEDVKVWLEKNGISKCIKNIMSSSYESKQDICLKNDIFYLCDDDIRHLKDDKIQSRVLFDTQKNKQVNLQVVNSWNQIEAMLL